MHVYSDISARVSNLVWPVHQRQMSTNLTGTAIILRYINQRLMDSNHKCKAFFLHIFFSRDASIILVSVYVIHTYMHYNSDKLLVVPVLLSEQQED